MSNKQPIGHATIQFSEDGPILETTASVAAEKDALTRLFENGFFTGIRAEDGRVVWAMAKLSPQRHSACEPKGSA